MPRRVRAKETENLSDSNIDRVIEALNSETPITKKAACEMLNISYNTTRLKKIIDERIENREFAKTRRAQLRNTPVDDFDKKRIVEMYLGGTSITEIADSTFRSTNVVKNVLKLFNIPLKNKAYTYEDPVDLEPEQWATDYKPNDLVYSARYNSVAKVDKILADNTYRIWLVGEEARYAYQPYHELADLRKVQKDLGLVVEEMSKEDMDRLIYEGLMKANRKMKERD